MKKVNWMVSMMSGAFMLAIIVASQSNFSAHAQTACLSSCDSTHTTCLNYKIYTSNGKEDTDKEKSNKSNCESGYTACKNRCAGNTPLAPQNHKPDDNWEYIDHCKRDSGIGSCKETDTKCLADAKIKYENCRTTANH